MKLKEFQGILMDDINVQKMINEFPQGWQSLVSRIENHIQFHKDRIEVLVETLADCDTPEFRKQLLESRMIIKAFKVFGGIPTELREAVISTQEALKEQGEDVFDPEGNSPLEAIKP